MNLRTAALSMALIAGLAGCRTARVRAEVSPILRCPESDIRIEEREPGTFAATGCGRLAICLLPQVDGGELQCAGGADPQHLREIQPLTPTALTEKKPQKAPRGSAPSAKSKRP